jgi:hypothetical protein
MGFIICALLPTRALVRGMMACGGFGVMGHSL